MHEERSYRGAQSWYLRKLPHASPRPLASRWGKLDILELAVLAEMSPPRLHYAMTGDIQRDASRALDPHSSAQPCRVADTPNH